MVETKKSDLHYFVRKHAIWILFAIFFLTVGLRLLFAFQTSEFSDDTAYYVMRQVEHIRAQGVPLHFDELSYNGRVQIAFPVYYYILAFFNLFMPLELVAKIIPNIFASLIIFIVFAISMRFTRNTSASVFASALSAFIPVFFLNTFNAASIYSFVMPLLLFSFYCFLNLSSDDRFITPYLISIIILSFTHPAVFLIVLGELLYIILLRMEKMQYAQIEVEAMLVSVFVVIWSQFLLYKNGFLAHGLSLIWQNTPGFVTDVVFRRTNVLEAILQVGAIPCIAGATLFYRAVHNQKSRFAMFFLAYSIPLFLLLWLRLINPELGLIFLSAVLILATSKYYQELSSYIDKTKVFFLKAPIVSVILLVTFTTSIAPTFALITEEVRAAPTADDVALADYIAQETNVRSVVLTSFEDGYFLQYHAKRPTVVDSRYLLIDNINQRFDDIKTFYTTPYYIEAMRIVDKYDINYVVLNDDIRTLYNIETSPTFSNTQCFEPVFASGTIELYKVTCMLDERTSRRL